MWDDEQQAPLLSIRSHSRGESASARFTSPLHAIRCLLSNMVALQHFVLDWWTLTTSRAYLLASPRRAAWRKTLPGFFAVLSLTDLCCGVNLSMVTIDVVMCVIVFFTSKMLPYQSLRIDMLLTASLVISFTVMLMLILQDRQVLTSTSEPLQGNIQTLELLWVTILLLMLMLGVHLIGVTMASITCSLISVIVLANEHIVLHAGYYIACPCAILAIGLPFDRIFVLLYLRESAIERLLCDGICFCYVQPQTGQIHRSNEKLADMHFIDFVKEGDKSKFQDFMATPLDTTVKPLLLSFQIHAAPKVKEFEAEIIAITRTRDKWGLSIQIEGEIRSSESVSLQTAGVVHHDNTEMSLLLTEASEVTRVDAEAQFEHLSSDAAVQTDVHLENPPWGVRRMGEWQVRALPEGASRIRLQIFNEHRNRTTRREVWVNVPTQEGNLSFIYGFGSRR